MPAVDRSDPDTAGAAGDLLDGQTLAGPSTALLRVPARDPRPGLRPRARRRRAASPGVAAERPDVSAETNRGELIREPKRWPT